MIKMFNIIVFLYLLFASIMDFRSREVPDIYNYTFIIGALLSNLYLSIINKDMSFIIFSFLGLLVSYIFGLILYFFGQWGGGDTKVLMGIGTLLGLKLNFLEFIIDTFILGSLFAIIFALYVLLRNLNKFRLEYTKKDIFIFIVMLLFSLGSSYLFDNIKLLIIALLYPLFVVIKSIEHNLFSFKIPVNQIVEGDWILDDYFEYKEDLDFNLIKNQFEYINEVKIQDTKSFKHYLKKHLYSKNKLDLLKTNIKLILSKKFKDKFNSINIEELINNPNNLDFLEKIGIEKINNIIDVKQTELEYKYKIYIAGPKTISASKDQINKLKENKIDFVVIKEGLPFVPAFFLAYLFSIYYPFFFINLFKHYFLWIKLM